ncbi:MAG: hypothetical protein ABEJ44_07450 [Halanaeroarchaeum sp.]
MSTDGADEDPEIPIVCEACGTRSTAPFSDVTEVITRHNEQLHDGEPEAEIDPEIKDHLNDLIARDLGLLE